MKVLKTYKHSNMQKLYHFLKKFLKYVNVEVICYLEFHCLFIVVSTIKVLFKKASPGCGNSSVIDQAKKAYCQLSNFRLNIFTSSIFTYYMFQIFHKRKNICFVMFQGWYDSMSQPATCQAALFYLSCCITRWYQLVFVGKMNVWSGRVTWYSIVIRMVYCLLAAGSPNGIWALLSLSVMATLFCSINTAKSLTCFIVAAANHQSGFFFLSIDWALYSLMLATYLCCCLSLSCLYVRVFQITLRGGGNPPSRGNWRFCWGEFFHQVVGTWRGVIFEPFSKLKTAFCKYWICWTSGQHKLSDCFNEYIIDHLGSTNNWCIIFSSLGNWCCMKFECNLSFLVFLVTTKVISEPC